ncbi:autotransporter outer membrane beta-barrel domain-containing protein [Campylobacter sp. US33a]|uniref:autotransporter outer membrane beta-barrel domain-containing protein n=1 Tax=Campylobacter sp. US33a TaxID=2498120 RepID=UPI001067EBBD|nr:autotransporter outer membrane beta-barrel domain-containing protein [Campylobacter sp. US33a]TEY02015.1 autotransporter outer membrane beta-barrel domain-containing protein [Campylobacter sp. US33a]
MYTTLIHSDDLITSTIQADEKHFRLDSDTRFFANTKGSFIKYNTGSYIDINTLSSVFGYVKELEKWNLENSLFIETGFSEYTSFNDTYLGSVFSNGKHRYLGLGYFAKKNDLFNQEGLYTQGYFKTGVIKNEFSVNTSIYNLDLDLSSAYFGTSLGLGYIKELKENILVDLYVRYFYDYIQGGEVNTSDNAKFDYNALNTHRIQSGLRLSWTLILS